MKYIGLRIHIWIPMSLILTWIMVMNPETRFITANEIIMNRNIKSNSGMGNSHKKHEPSILDAVQLIMKHSTSEDFTDGEAEAFPSLEERSRFTFQGFADSLVSFPM